MLKGFLCIQIILYMYFQVSSLHSCGGLERQVSSLLRFSCTYFRFVRTQLWRFGKAGVQFINVFLYIYFQVSSLHRCGGLKRQVSSLLRFSCTYIFRFHPHTVVEVCKGGVLFINVHPDSSGGLERQVSSLLRFSGTYIFRFVLTQLWRFGKAVGKMKCRK